jgi:hypothetical protein
MTMDDETGTYDWFLHDTRAQAWIVQCSVCLAYGRKAETPSTIPHLQFKEFTEMFPIMELDEAGRCIQCRQVEARQIRGVDQDI